MFIKPGPLISAHHTSHLATWDCWPVNLLYVGDSNPSLKNLVQLGLIQQLWVSGLVGLQFYCHFLVGTRGGGGGRRGRRGKKGEEGE